MEGALSPRTRRLLDIQGFDAIPDKELAPVAPWLRLAFGMCTAGAAVGTLTASPKILLSLAPIAALGAALPVHPFDLVYDYGVRRLTGTGPLPERGAPLRFACGLGTAWLLATAWSFATGRRRLGYALGSALTGVGLLVSTTDVCIPSMIYRTIFGWPRRRELAAG